MEKHLWTAKVMTDILERRFKLFGFEFGIDPIVGLVAGAGDIITVILGLYFVWIGLRINLPINKLFEMLWNLGLDFALGSIPLIGDIFDFTFRAHAKNYTILKDHYEKNGLYKT